MFRGTVTRRRVMQRGALGGVGVASAWLLACGGGDSKSGSAATATSGGAAARQATATGPVTPGAGGTFNAVLAYNPPLDVHKVSAAAQQVAGGVQSRLFAFKTGTDPKVILDKELENDLGVSIESPDAQTWTVKLRPDAKFHNIAPVNGHAVEAEDIKATYTRALDPATGNPNRGTLNMIDPAKIETPDKTTVVFKLNFQYAPFRSTVSSPTYSQMMPREVLSGGYDPSKQLIGSGPFMLDSFTPDVAYNYKRNPEWYDKGRPYIDGVKVAVVPDLQQQIAQFAAGNLDELILSTPNDVKTAQQRVPKAQVFKARRASPYPLYFQMGDPTSPFQDIRLRRAVSIALDRDAIGRAIYEGEYEQVVFVPAYMGKWALSVNDLEPNLKQWYQYNPAEAKKLVEAAGATGMNLKVAYPVNGPGAFGADFYAKHAETIANMLGQVGFKVALVTHDYNKDFVGGGRGSRQGNFDKDTMMFAAAGSNTEADEFLYSYFHSKSTSNQLKLNDPQFDAMLDKQRTLVNDAERLKAIIDIQKYLADKLYAPSTVANYEWAVVQPKVQNYQYSHTLGKMTESYAKLGVKG